MTFSRPAYSTSIYNPNDFGPAEVELYRLFRLQRDDARNYFLTIIKPRLDRSYKLYIAYGGDRQREIKAWQSNVQIPYVQAVVETMVPRIVDARPEFTIKGRTEALTEKTEKLQQLMYYNWEKASMDQTTEDFVRATLIFGTGFLQVSWKKDVRTLNFLDTKDITDSKPKWKKQTKTFYDGPMCEHVSAYALWYDWHNSDRKSKQYWLKRLVLTEGEIRRRYPAADPRRLEMAFNSPGGDLIDYEAIKWQTRTTHIYNTKSSQAQQQSASGTVYGTDKYYSTQSNTLKMFEVYEWWRPFDDAYSVIVGGAYVPIFNKGAFPNPYDFKEAPFIEATYLKIPGEFEGYGIPLILESPQVILNLIKNQRLDAATLSIHKMWVVNPLANVNKDDLVTRPFGIIYSIDPNGVREIQFSDVKPSSYKEEELLKADMQYASGVDDFSMGVGGGASSATEVRHLRESTLERVRMFINHLGTAYSDVLRYWMDLTRQLGDDKQTIRVIGADGKEQFPLIEKDDLRGEYDYKATVLPSLAGQDDVKKKQDMDLFQLLIQLPFVDQQKLVGKVISDFGWSLDTIIKDDAGQPQVGPDGQPIDPSMAGAAGAQGAMPQGMPQDPTAGGMPPMMPPQGGGNAPQISPALTQALSMIKKPGAPASGPSSFQQMSQPVNLTQQPGMPPTAPGIPTAQGGPGYRPAGKTTNPSGSNRTGKVNTDVARNKTSNTEDRVLNRAFNIQ
jgi:hypothetical protein